MATQVGFSVLLNQLNLCACKLDLPVEKERSPVAESFVVFAGK